MRHLTLVNPDDLPRVQVALGTARLLVDIARAELDVTAANLEAAQAAYLSGGAA
jgi:hypothetical protein